MRVRLIRLSVLLALLASACGGAAVAERRTTDAGIAARAGVVGLQGTDGRIALIGAGDRALTKPALVTEDGERAVVADVTDRTTHVQWLSTATGAVLESLDVPGVFALAALDVPGRAVALVSPGGTRARDAIAPTRDQTEIAVVTGTGVQLRSSFDGNLVPEAFATWYLPGSIVPGTAYLLEYVPAAHPTHYRVRTLDLSTGTVGLPVSLRDKTTTVDQLMAGVSRTQLLASDAGLLFTLYRGHHDEGRGSYAFVHTLGLGNGVWCLAVPDSMELADEPGALALDASGKRLLAVSANGTIAAIPLASIVDLNALPEFAAPHPLSARTNRAPAAAVAGDVVWVALGDRLVRVDSASLEPAATSHLPVDVEALGVASDGRLVAAGAGRLLVIGDDGQVQEDQALPDGVGAVARILTRRRSA